MQTSDISSLAASSSGTSTIKTTGSQDLGRDQFLQMLIAQLQHQDPLDPQDASQFTAQLAQFTSLDQLVSMRTSIEQLARAETTGQSLSAAALIGRNVLIESDGVTVPATGAPSPVVLEAADATSLTQAALVDADGRVVAKTGPFEVESGQTVLDWSKFDRIPAPGAYQLQLSAAGGSSAPRILVEGAVSGATFVNGSAQLIVGPNEVPLSALREIRS